MIQVTQNIVKTINGNWSVKRVAMNNTLNKWMSVVEYICKDENGNRIETFSKTYTGEAYNTWFNSYNSGTFLLQELLEKQQIQANIPEDIEGQFLNNVNSSENTETNL